MRETQLAKSVSDLRLLYKSISPLIETDDCDGAEFYGFCDDFWENIGRRPLEIEEDLKFQERELEIFNGDAEECEDAKTKYEMEKEDLQRQISLSLGFGGFRERLIERDEDMRVTQWA